MSDDYISYVAWVRPATARRIAEDASSSVDSPIVDADGQVVFRPGIDRPFRPKAIARAVGKEQPGAAELVLSEVGPNAADALDDVPRRRWVMTSSSRVPLLPLIDRVIAIPHAVRFMEGLGFARLRPNRRDQLGAAWPELIENLGGVRNVARSLGPYLAQTSDEDEATKTLAAIAKGLARAEARGLDLLLMTSNAAR